MKSLSIIYDPRCGLCTAARNWLLTQESDLDLRLIAADNPEVSTRYPSLSELVGQELIAVDDRDGVYIGPDAWIMCIYALPRYRWLSFTLASKSLKPLASKAFGLLSSGRHTVSNLLGLKSEQEIRATLELSSDATTQVCAGENPV